MPYGSCNIGTLNFIIIIKAKLVLAGYPQCRRAFCYHLSQHAWLTFLAAVYLTGVNFRCVASRTPTFESTVFTAKLALVGYPQCTVGGMGVFFLIICHNMHGLTFSSQCILMALIVAVVDSRTPTFSSTVFTLTPRSYEA